MQVVNKYTKIDIVPTHTFNNGVYTRGVTLPKDSIILGEIHKYATINVVSKGKILVVDVTSGEEIYIEAPYVFTSNPGVQKLAYVLEECIWSNIIVTDLTDIQEIEDKYLIKKEVQNVIHYDRSSSRNSK